MQELAVYLLVRRYIWYKQLRVKIAVDIELAITETFHGDPVAQRFQLLPDLRMSFLDPGFDMSLLLITCGRIKPISKTDTMLARPS